VPGSLADTIGPGDVVAQSVGASDVGAAPPDLPLFGGSATPAEGDESLLAEFFADLAPSSPGVTAAIAVGSAAALVAGRSIASGGASMAVTNVRLLPCIAMNGVERGVATAAQLVKGSSASAASNGGVAEKVAEGAAVAGSASASLNAQREGSPGRLAALTAPVAQGFDRVVNGPGDEDEDALQDTRLLMQLGMLLGIVYVGFASTWFWATRRHRDLHRRDALPPRSNSER
jgi:hypothetical protein